MKKQILAAAVAASVSAVALADISITGAAKVNYTNVDVSGSTPDTNKFTQETDLKIKGKNGDTEVVVNFGGASLDNTASTSDARTGSSNNMNVEDVYVTTKIAGVNLKAGTWDNGNNELRASSRADGKFNATTSVGGIDLGFATGSNGASQEEFTVGTNVGGVALSYTKKATGETVKASTSVGGVNVKYLGLPSDTANNDRTYVEVSTDLGGVGVKVGSAKAESAATLEGDSWLGDYEHSAAVKASRTAANPLPMYLDAGQDIMGVELSTSLAGNKVAFRNISVDDVAGKDMDINKLIVTRPLASGATFELTYTELDSDRTNADSSTLDLELAVSF
jgi:hypothetical protein